MGSHTVLIIKKEKHIKSKLLSGYNVAHNACFHMFIIRVNLHLCYQLIIAFTVTVLKAEQKVTRSSVSNTHYKPV